LSSCVGYFDFDKAVKEVRAWLAENKEEIHLLAELSRTRRKLEELQNQKQQATATVEA
jgi:hypothetical protein